MRSLTLRPIWGLVSLPEDFPGGWVVKNLPPNASAAEDAPLIPWLGRLIPWRRNPTLVFLPNNPTDRGASAECRRIDAFELWCWRRLLRVSWAARRSNQSILKDISPEYSWEGLMLKLKRQYLGHLMQRNDSFEKTLMLGKIEGGRKRG